MMTSVSPADSVHSMPETVSLHVQGAMGNSLSDSLSQSPLFFLFRFLRIGQIRVPHLALVHFAIHSLVLPPPLQLWLSILDPAPSFLVY